VLDKKDSEDLPQTSANPISTLITWLFDSASLESFTTQQTGNFHVELTRINKNVFLDAYDQMADEPLNVSYYDDTTVRGDISVKNDGLMFLSIPFDTRWHIYVDGKEQEKIQVMSALMGAGLKAGDHQIELIYKPEGITSSAIISLGSLAVIALLIIVGAVRKRSETLDHAADTRKT
jgi:uncharacterized membrane protein YfhO